jgi:CRP-like cAMP-binding protein
MKIDLEKGLSQLHQISSAIHPLNGSEWDAFSSVWQTLECKRKTVLTTVGETERYLYFVIDGIQRVYYTDEKEREATLVFMYPPSFAGVLNSFLLQKPSPYFFETLTPSVLLKTSFNQLNALMDQYPAIEKLIRKGLSQVINGLLERQVELQCFSAEEKFRSLLKRSPQVLQLISHKYLANYLGIDPTYFSKLMSSVRI